MRFTRLASVVLASCVAIASSQAQNPSVSSLAPGDTVRVWAVGPRLNGDRGVLADVVRDTLKLADFALPPAPIASVPYAMLRRVDVQRGKRRSPFRIAAGIIGGAALGAYALGYLGAEIECGATCGDEGDLEGIAGGLLGGGLGFILGGTTGGIITARMRVPNWRPVVIPSGARDLLSRE
jgi:hypothetical protein